VARTETREYKLWLSRDFGGGYHQYFDWEP
jgi:hypothetical protein